MPVGPGPLSTSLELIAPDGVTALASWNAAATGVSPPVTLGFNGDYTIVATIDGDGTGAATVSVTPS